MTNTRDFPIDIVGGSNPGRVPKISIESTWNAYISDDALIFYPGYKKQLSIDNDYLPRALYLSTLGDFMVAVIGDGIYKITVVNEDLGTLQADKIGSLGTRSSDVQISENGNSQIAICDGFTLHVWDYKNGDVVVTDVQGITPNSTCDILGYVAVSALDKNGFYYSNVNQLIDIPANPPPVPLAIPAFPIDNSGEIGSDKIVGLYEFKEILWVFGQTSTKIWSDRGLDFNPLQLDQSVVINYGALNKNCIASSDEYLCWIARSANSNPYIVATNGGIPEKISTDGIAYKISKLKNVENCYAFMFTIDNHSFYQCTWPDANFTLVYDFDAKNFFYASDENLNYHIAKKVVFFHNRYYFIPFNESAIYELNSDYEDYDGKIIPRIRITKPIRMPDYSLFRTEYVDVIMEQGVNEESGYVDLSFSKDGGRSFGNYIRVNMADLGNVDGLVRFHNIGAARDLVFQFRFYTSGRMVSLFANGKVN